MKPSLREELIARAKLGEITPDEAETEALFAECGPLEVRPYPIDLDQISNHPDLDPIGEQTWTLLMTLAWIITRDPIAVRAVWVKGRRTCTHWAAFSLPEAHGNESNDRTGWELEPLGAPTVSDVNAICEIDEDEFDFLLPPIITTGACAREELWNRLSSGQLRAEGKRHGTSERAIILSSDWLHLNWLQDPSASADTVGNRAENIALYDDLCVSGQDVREIWKPLEKLNCEQFEREDWTVEQALPWIAYGEPTVLHFVGRSNLRAERQRSITQRLFENG